MTAAQCGAAYVKVMGDLKACFNDHGLYSAGPAMLRSLEEAEKAGTTVLDAVG
jgi:hypothetical protein